MPKLSENVVPSYRFHKSSGQAMVTLNGHDVCLGKHSTPASRAKYNQVIAQWIANDRAYQPVADDLTSVELVERDLPFVAQEVKFGVPGLLARWKTVPAFAGSIGSRKRWSGCCGFLA